MIDVFFCSVGFIFTASRASLAMRLRKHAGPMPSEGVVTEKLAAKPEEEGGNPDEKKDAAAAGVPGPEVAAWKFSFAAPAALS